jgi:hypothetical protein
MRGRYILLGMALLAMLLFFNKVSAQQPVINSTNITMLINSTQSFINQVNKSGYLVFYPNLAQSYKYLDMAKNVYQSNQTDAYYLLAEARSSAQMQLQSINKYRQISLYAMVILAIVSSVLLYIYMKPRKS